MNEKLLYLSPDCEALDINQERIICESLVTDELPGFTF